MAGARGRLLHGRVGRPNHLIVPTHDLVVVRLGHYQGEALGTPALARALSLVLPPSAIARPSWQPPRLPP